MNRCCNDRGEAACTPETPDQIRFVKEWNQPEQGHKKEQSEARVVLDDVLQDERRFFGSAVSNLVFAAAMCNRFPPVSQAT